MKCEHDGMALNRGERCPSCTLYNAAVTAINTAAKEIATAYDSRARDAWMNGHGVFAWIGDAIAQVGSPEQAAPFVALTGACRRVITFKRKASQVQGKAE